MSKRILSLVLALVMVLGTFSFSLAAPSDVEGTEYEKAVERLMLLGIITGYPDGSFKPENNITRAEFAAVALRARGLEYTAQAAKGLPTGFSDVPASHWASGYVGAAAKAGIVNGIGNGKFAPEAPVKYEEAVTMLVRALGYEVDAQAKGGYPHGYLIVANEIGLLDEVRGIPGAPATRGMVAQMTDNALEIAMMIQVGYGDEAKWVVSGTEGTEKVTLLNKLDVDEITGDVIATFRIDSSLDNDEIKIKELNGKTTTFEITENIDADAVLGAGVTAWAKDDVIFAISIGYEEEIRGKNYSFDADQIAYDEISSVDEEEVELYVKDDTFDWEDAVVYLNNEKVKDLDDTDLVGAYGRFIFNEDDEVVFAYLFKFDDVGLVTSISEDEIEFINAADADEDGLALDDAEEIYVFNKDLSAASLDDIEEDTAIFFWIDADDNYYIVINNETVEGTLEAVRTTDSRVTVDGTNMVPGSKRGAFSVYSADAKNEFNLWDSKNFSAIKDYVDENVVVYKDLVGDALALVTDSDATSTVYGIATWLTDARKPVLTVFTKDGEEVDYAFEDRADYQAIKNDFNFDGDKVVAVKFELNKDGEIKEGTIKTYANIENAYKDDSKKYIEVGSDRYYIEKDTIILKAVNNKGKLKPSVIDYEDIINKEFDATTNVIYITKSDTNDDLALLVFTDADFAAKDDTQYGIITDHPHKKGGDYVAKIDVVGGEEKEYVLSSLEYNNRDLAKGDLIKFYFNNDDEVVVEGIKVLSVEKDNILKVDSKDDNYLTIGGTKYRVSDETIFYVTTNKGALDTTSRLSKIEKGDTVVILANNDNELKVVVETTPYTATLQPQPGGDNGATGTVTYKNTTIIADDTVEVLSIKVTEGKVYKVTVQKEGTSTATDAKVGIIADATYTANDLGITLSTSGDVNYVVKVYEDDKEISSKVITVKDSTKPILNDAKVNAGSTGVEATATFDSDITIKAKKVGTAANGYTINVTVDTSATETQVGLTGKIFTVVAKNGATKADVAEALNANVDFARLFTATTTSTDAATDGESAITSGGVDASEFNLQLTFTGIEMKPSTTVEITVNDGSSDHVVEGTVTWNATNNVATVTFAEDVSTIVQVGNTIKAIDLVSKNGVAVELTAPVTIN